MITLMSLIEKNAGHVNHFISYIAPEFTVHVHQEDHEFVHPMLIKHFAQAYFNVVILDENDKDKPAKGSFRFIWDEKIWDFLVDDPNIAIRIDELIWIESG